MGVICFSKDDILGEKLVALYGVADVILSPGFSLPKENDRSGFEVMIVDLKYNQVPQENSKLPLPTIVLTAIPNFQEALLLLRRGVKGYGNRHMRQENLAQAVDNVKVGQIWLPPAIITRMIGMMGTGNGVQADHDLLSRLSKREQEVALFVAEGMTNQEMADKMFVSLRTIKAHLSSIYEKTGLRNRLELGLELKAVSKVTAALS